MGIRINKQLGYGILIQPEGKDPRINYSALEEFQDSERIHETSLADYGKWVKDNSDNILEIAREESPHHDCKSEHQVHQHIKSQLKVISFVHRNDEKQDNLYKAFTYDNEFGNVSFEGVEHEVMLFSPPGAPDWRRYDDLIDYSEAYSLDNTGVASPANSVKLLKCSGIYPWIGEMKRIGAGPTDPELAEKFRNLSNEIGMEPKDKAGSKWFSAINYFTFLKRKSNSRAMLQEYMATCFRPALPTDIVALIMWMGIFKDIREALNGLRPLIYTYWS